MPVKSAFESHISNVLAGFTNERGSDCPLQLLRTFCWTSVKVNACAFKKNTTFLSKGFALPKEQSQHQADYSLPTWRTTQVLEQRWHIIQQGPLLHHFARNQHYYAESQHTITRELQKISTVLTWSPHTVGLRATVKVRQFDLPSIFTI